MQCRLYDSKSKTLQENKVVSQLAAVLLLLNYHFDANTESSFTWLALGLNPSNDIVMEILTLRCEKKP